MSRRLLVAITTLFWASSTFALPQPHTISVNPSATASKPVYPISTVPSITTSGDLSIASPSPTTSDDAELHGLLAQFNSTDGSEAPQVIEDGEEYVVLFNANHPTPPILSDILNNVGLDRKLDIKYVFNNSAFKGFAGTLKGGHIDALNGMDEISLVEASVQVASFSPFARANVPWGLQRISQDGPVSGQPGDMSFSYRFDSAGGLGQGVDIYVLDTGINTAHEAFGGRARMGFSMEGSGDLGPNSDADGHGTHVSGTAAGFPYGVATSANIIGVKVLGASGSGSSSDTLKGLDYVVNTHDANKGTPGFVASVASMSWGLNAKMTAIEQAIDAAISNGIHVSVAAGNAGGDACASSPSSSGGSGGGAVAVGSFNINEQISSFSNTGGCVDIYAPGESVISTWIGSTTAIKVLSGTSMSCPHVTGLMAYLAAQNPSLAQDPAAMKQYISSTSLQGLRSSSTALVVNNGFKGATVKTVKGPIGTS